MKKFILGFFLICTVIFTVRCNKSSSSDTKSNSAVSIPKVAGSVITVQVQNLTAQNVQINSTSGIPLSSPFPSSVPTPPHLEDIYSDVNSFLDQAKLADTFSCFSEKLANAGVVKTDGTVYVFKGTDSNPNLIKFSMIVSNGNLNTYKMHVCSTSSSTQNMLYLSGSNISSSADFTLKVNVNNLLKLYSHITGSYSNDSWLNKSLTNQLSLSSFIYNDQITQYKDTMQVNKTVSLGSFSTQIFGAFNLFGNAANNYAIGGGTLKVCANSCVSDSFEHWLDDGSGTSTPTSFLTQVTNATFLSKPAVFDQDYKSDETWDCTDGTATVISEASLSADISSQLNLCNP